MSPSGNHDNAQTRRHNLHHALSGMLGRNIADLQLSRLEKLILEQLHGPAMAQALAYFREYAACAPTVPMDGRQDTAQDTIEI